MKKARSRRYPTKIMTDADYADDPALLSKIPVQTESLLHSTEKAAGGIDFNVNELYSHNQLYVHISMQKKISLTLYSRKGCERVDIGYVWEMSWRPNRTATYWPPTHTLLAIIAFFFRSPGLLNRGPGGPAYAGTWFSFQHLLSNCSELPVAGVCNNLTSTYFLRASQFRTQFNPSTVKVTPDLLISSTGCTCYLHRCVSSFDSLAGPEVNMQQMTIKQSMCVKKKGAISTVSGKLLKLISQFI